MDLKDYFRDELAYIKELAQESSNNSSIFHDFLTSFDNENDIEYLFEHFAFLMAKLHQNIDDAFPEITQNLLSRVWPTPIRPIPSTSILQFMPKSADIHHLSKGSEVKSQAVQSENCIYHTVRDKTIIPLEVKSCNLVNTPNGCKISLKIKWKGSLTETKTWKTLPIDFFLSTNTHIAGFLQLWFQQYLTSVTVIQKDKTFTLSRDVVSNFVPAPEKLILPLEQPLFWRLQLLQEYFYLPHVNDFLTINLHNELFEIELDEDNTFTIVFQFNEPLITVLQLDNTNSFLTNCVPIINLFKKTTPLLNFEPGKSSYTLKLANNNNIYQINEVYSPLEPAKQVQRGEKEKYIAITEFATNSFSQIRNIYYQSMFKNSVTGKVKSEITFINSQGESFDDFCHENFICNVTATNGDKVNMLNINDIYLPTQTISSSLAFKNITKPTTEIPPIVDSYQHWSIISHLSLSTVFLKNIDAIKQLISDLNYHGYLNAPLKLKQDKALDGIVDVNTRPIDWIFNCDMQRGIEMIITLDPKCFENEGEMYRFSLMLTNVFPFCVTSNNFLMVKIINLDTQRIWELAPIHGSREQI